MTLVFTLCSNNYLAQAITLGDSLLRYNSEYKYVIGLVDRVNSGIDYSLIHYEVLEVEKIGITDFDVLYKKYNIIELNTAVKPFYFQYFFDNNTIDLSQIIYLDPDIMVFSSFTCIEEETRSSDIIITPHFTTPLNDDKLQTEEDFLNAGLYNLGFLLVKNSPEGTRMLTWWADRLRYKAFIDLKRGLFTDQIWINFVPLFFKRVKILIHPGFNMAYWNMHERKLTKENGRYYVNDIEPLVFYHFSGFNPLFPSILSRYQNRFIISDYPEIGELFKYYSDKLFLNGFENFITFQNEYTIIKSKLDKERRKKMIQDLPFFIRLFRILVFKISSKYNLLLD